jgi:lysophospholipid acyltransferase (LPLAT)-like uncharacterized protein
MLKNFLQSASAQTAIAGLAARYLRFVAATTSWRIEGDASLTAFAEGAPCIVAFWHEALPAMPIFWLRAKTRMPAPLRATVLASRHRDGQLIAAIVKRLGISVVSGSSSKGGAGALRALVTALKSGQHIGLTPDGPRGPRRIAAPGTAQLAAMTGAAILPCAAATSWAIQLKSWDAMRFPLPFGRGRLVCAPFIHITRDSWEAAIPALEAALTGAMDQARA